MWEEKDAKSARDIQIMLNKLIENGFINSRTITETDYGTQTLAAVKKFQKKLNELGYRDRNGNRLAEDGLWGGNTGYAYSKFILKTAETLASRPIAKLKAAVPFMKTETLRFQPVDGGKPAYNYDAVRNQYQTENGEIVPRHHHHGIDIYARKGAKISAAVEGTVTMVRWASESPGGNMVEVTLGDGKKVIYAHLDRITVKKGESVQETTNIGTVGKTGFSKESRIDPHLHIEIFEEVNGKRRYIDPTTDLSNNYKKTRTARGIA
jgi:murein DD-endopeptidase MepM/ murein hydrolase activator NlpD